MLNESQSVSTPALTPAAPPAFPVAAEAMPQAAVRSGSSVALQDTSDIAHAVPGAALGRPHLIIRPTSGWVALNLRELWEFRGLLLSFASRDLKLRYKQTALGVIWVVLQPLLAAGIFTFVFGRVAKMPSDGKPYFLFSFAGLLAWNLFSNTLTRAGTCLVGNAQLISKVFFPRVVLPLSTVLSVLVDFAVALAMLVVLLVVHGFLPPIAIVLMPFWGLLILMFATGLGLVVASLTVNYRDVQHMLPVLVQLLLYASPVAYSVSAVPGRLRFWYSLNPLVSLLEAFRGSLLGAPAPALGWLAYSAAAAVLVLLGGVACFKRMERGFADVI